MLKYIKLTLEYLFGTKSIKKILFFVLFSVLPAGLLAYGAPVSKLYYMVADTAPKPFPITWLTLFSSKYVLVALIIGFFLLALSLACISSAMTYHMKVGSFTFPRFFTSLNNSFLPSLMRLVLFTLSLLVVYTLYALLDSLWDFAVGHIASVILSTLSLLILSTLLTYALATTTLWLPTMLLAGYRYLDSLTRAFYQSRSCQRKLFAPSLLCSLVIGVFGIGAYFTLSHPFWSWLLSFVPYLIVIIFDTPFMFVAFFSENKLQRADIPVNPYKRSY